ncbi:flippase [Spirochaetia bacterium]|nr:flippase [Spirochaetia bacterium]
MNSLKKNALFNILRNVMMLLFPLITFPYASRILSPDGIGKVNFANSIVNYFSLIAGLGIANYGVREGAKLQKNKERLSKLAKELLIISIYSSAVSYLIFFIIFFSVPKLYDYHSLLLISSSVIFFKIIGFDWFFGAIEEYQYIAIRSIVVQFISLFLLFLFVKSRDDYLQYAAFGIFASVGSNIYNFIHIHKFINLRIKVKLELKKHLLPVFILFFYVFISNIYKIFGTTILGFITNDNEVGFYSAASKINTIVLAVIVAAIGVLMPRLSFHVNNNEHTIFNDLVNKALVIVLCIAVPSSFGLFFLSKPIILVFSGIEYTNAIPAMQFMTPTTFLLSITTLIGAQMFIPLNKEKLTIIALSIGAFFNFVLNMILIPLYGATGAAITTLCTELLVAAILICMARKIIIWKSFCKNIIQYLLASAIMSLVIVLVMTLTGKTILQLLISIFLGMIVYFSFLLIIKNETIILIRQKLLPQKR